MSIANDGMPRIKKRTPDSVEWCLTIGPFSRGWEDVRLGLPPRREYEEWEPSWQRDYELGRVQAANVRAALGLVPSAESADVVLRSTELAEQIAGSVRQPWLRERPPLPDIDENGEDQYQVY